MVSLSFTFILKISGVGGKLTRVVYLAPRLVFWKYLIACKFFNIILKGNINRAGVASSKFLIIYQFSRVGGKLSRAVCRFGASLDSLPPPHLCNQAYETE